MGHLPVTFTILLILFIVLQKSNSIKIDKSKFDAIKKSRSVNTNIQSKRFGKSLIVPPIPPVPPVPFFLTFEIINKSCHNKSSDDINMYTMFKRRKENLNNNFKRKRDPPVHLGTTTTVLPQTTSPRTITTTLKPITSTQPATTTVKPITFTQAATTTMKPVTTTQPATTTVKPISSTQAATPTMKPVTTTQAATIMMKPVTTTQPATTTVKPVTTTQAATTTMKPVTTTQLATTTVKPITSTQAATTTMKPVTTTEPATITTLKSSTTTVGNRHGKGVGVSGLYKLVGGLLVAGTVVFEFMFLLFEFLVIIPGILRIIIPIGGGGGGDGGPDRNPNPDDPEDSGSEPDSGSESDSGSDSDDDCDDEENKMTKEECKKRKRCMINIKEISDNYPLIIKHTDHSKFLYPQHKGKIILEPDDKITFGCNSADTYFCKNNTIIENVISHKERDISSMSCSFSTIRSTIKFLQGYVGKKLQYKKFQIGLSYGSNFLPTITGYYDVALQSTSFVRSILSGALGYKQKQPPQRQLQQDLLEWSPDVYDLSRQQDTFSDLLFCHGNSMHESYCTYVNKHSYLEPTLLTPASHFVYKRAADTAYYYMNSAPMWNTIKHGNWAKIEKHVTRIAWKLERDLTVITGVYGQLRLPDLGGKFYRDIFMEHNYDECTSRIVVPLYFWKLVYDPVGENGIPNGIVYVTVNNPFIDSTDYYRICQKPGQTVDGESPANWDPNLFKQGFSYVCAIDDFVMTTRLHLIDRLP